MIETEKGKTQGPGERGRVVEGSERRRGNVVDNWSGSSCATFVNGIHRCCERTCLQ